MSSLMHARQVLYTWAMVVFFFFFFWWYCSLNSRLSTCKARALLLETCPSLFFLSSTRVLNSGSHACYAGALTTWFTPPALFCDGFFKVRFLQTAQGWLWTAMLLISASWVARITRVSHWHLAPVLFALVYFSSKICYFCPRPWTMILLPLPPEWLRV
jgi:hypothetical protein